MRAIHWLKAAEDELADIVNYVINTQWDAFTSASFQTHKGFLLRT